MDTIIEIDDSDEEKVDRYEILLPTTINIIIILYCFISDVSISWCTDRMITFYYCFLPILLIYANNAFSLYIFSTLRKTTRSFDIDYLSTMGFMALNNIFFIMMLYGYRTIEYCHPQSNLGYYFKWITIVSMIVFIKQLHNIKMMINSQ